MNKEDYIKIVKEKLNNKTSKIIIKQINKYYKTKKVKLPKNKYKIGNSVKLEKGTLLHGTYKNIDGLKEIINNGLISSIFIEGRGSKYPYCVGVWNLKKDYLLKDYINFYSGGTVRYFNQLDGNNNINTEIIPLNKMNTFINKFITNKYLAWKMEQTKEARFMPSLVQNQVQICIIFNANYSKELLKGDILNPQNVSDNDVKDFINEWYKEKFITDRKNKDDFFTDRESAILFGIPSNLIEGILVGRKYEKNKRILKEIKTLLPNCYICNLEGKVIY